MLNRLLSVITLMILFTSTPLCAAMSNWQVVPERSSVNFSLTPLNGETLAGSFDRLQGNIKIDPHEPEKNRAHLVIDTQALSATTHEMQQTLASPQYLNTSTYPHINFHAKQFMYVGNSSYLMRGTVTVRKKQIPITLVMVLDELNKQRANLRGSGLIQGSALSLLTAHHKSSAAASPPNVRVDFSIALVR